MEALGLILSIGGFLMNGSLEIELMGDYFEALRAFESTGFRKALR